MSYQLKVLTGLDRGNFAIVITRGAVDFTGFERIFDQVIDATRTLLDCKVLLDFQDSTLQFLPSDLRIFWCGLSLKNGRTATRSRWSLRPRGSSSVSWRV